MESKKVILPKMKNNFAQLGKKDEFCDQLLTTTQSFCQASKTYKEKFNAYSIKNDSDLLKFKAKNIINKSKQFDSPELIFALSDAIRQQAGKIVQEGRNDKQNYFRTRINQNKTFHCQSNKRQFFGQKKCSNLKLKKDINLPKKELLSKNSSKVFNKSQVKINEQNMSGISMVIQREEEYHYAYQKERNKALSLVQWIKEKLNKLLQRPEQITLQSINDYNQTVINYGLGEIIQSVRKRCRQEAQALKYIWDHTFALFQNLFSVLTTQLKRRQQQYEKNQKQLENIFQQNLDYLKNYNNELQKDSELLYDKMKRVILWNRRLRNDRYKQNIKQRVMDYRLQTYHSALEEATSMLLLHSSEPDCAKLAKKIISKLYRQKNQKKKKVYQKQAEKYVNEASKNFVRKWLRNFEFKDDNVEQVLTLTNQEKLDLMMRNDQDQKNKVDIYDFFQTYSRGVQAQPCVQEKAVQYQFNDNKKFNNTGVGTKQIYTMNKGIQSVMQQPQKILKSTKKQVEKRSNQSIIIPSRLKKSQKNKSFIQQTNKNLGPIKNKNRNSKRESVHASFSKYKQQLNVCSNESIQVLAEDQLSMLETGKNTIQRSRQNQLLSELTVWNPHNPSFYDNPDENGISKGYISVNFLANNQQSANIIKNDRLKRRKSIDKAKSTAHGLNSQIYSEKKIELGYKHKNLLRNKFQQTYELQMREQVLNNRQQMIKGVIRKRSFYKSSKNRPNDKQISILQMYKLNQHQSGMNKGANIFNELDDQILQHFSSFVKGNQTASNITKLKNYLASQNTMSMLANSINSQKNMKPVPRNKHFINLSVTNITRTISHLMYDYLRKIKADRENIFLDCQKIYYPLAHIFVEKMTNKYGLKDIAQKKIRDFLEKISSFARVNQRLDLFYRLLGKCDDPNQKLGGDQLLIYMKSIVYFDINRTVSVLNVNKDFSIDRAATNKEVVLQQIPQLIKQFFPDRLFEQVLQKVVKYFETYQLSWQFQIQKIANILIEYFVKQKMRLYDDFLQIHQKLKGNFYLNLYKCIEMVRSQIKDQQIKKQLKIFFSQCFKASDILDEVYGKSISQQKFAGLCFKYDFPTFSEFQKMVLGINKEFFECLNLKPQPRSEDWQLLRKISKSKKIHLYIQPKKPQKRNFEWCSARVVFQVTQICAFSLLGNLGQLKKSYTSLVNKGQIST